MDPLGRLDLGFLASREGNAEGGDFLAYGRLRMNSGCRVTR